MSTKSFFHSSLKFILVLFASGLSTFMEPVPNSAKAALGSISDCPDEGNSDPMSEDCYQTPETMEIKFYEIGFCTTSDPLSSGSFTRTNCNKAWDSTSGETLDLATFNYQGLRTGLTHQVPNQTYEYAYVIVDNTWGLKGKAYFNDQTYYTTTDGSGSTDESDYGKADLQITDMGGGSGCWDFSETTDYGPVLAVITDSNLTTASSASTCNNTTRLIGSIDLNTPVVMTSDVTSYNLTWVITKMGLYVDWNTGGTYPSGFGGGPFVPTFTLSK